MAIAEKSVQRWKGLWERLGAKGDANEVLKYLVALYSESHRAYHTLSHIEHCLDEFDQVRHLVASLDAVELALWCHDAVYDTRAQDNEERSADLAVRVVKDASLPNSFGQTVAGFITATKHSDHPTHPDIQILVDIDLAILGQSENRFDEYEEQIREEYGWVLEDQFIAGRSAILESFQDRRTVYFTKFFQDKYEVKARRNIARSLARLRA